MTEFPWLKGYPQGVNWSESIPEKPLWTVLEESAVRIPEKICLDFLGKTLKYQQVWEGARRFAAALQREGLQKGDRVALLLPNCPAFVMGYYGILLAGGTVVNFNPLAAVEEIKQQLADSGAKRVLTTNLCLIYEKVEAARLAGLLEKVFLVDFPKQMGPVQGLAYRLLCRKDLMSCVVNWSGLESFEKSIKIPSIPKVVSISPRADVALLQYTGGTTGTPKAAMLTHYNLYANTQQTSAWASLKLQPPHSEVQDVIMAVLPLFHVFAMTAVMNLGLYRGMKLILQPRFAMKMLLKGIKSKKPTVMPGVPSMFAAIANYAEVQKYDLSSLVWCVTGGAGLPQEVRMRFEEMTGCALVEGYGLTEASPVCSCNPPGQNRTGSIGLPLPGTEFVICDPDKPGKPFMIGEKGEVCIRGPQVMKGYWNRPEETAKVIVTPKEGGEPMLRTGDVGYMDADGYVHIVDRLKELIITNGYNVYPRHVEEELYKHPAILEAAVVGVEEASMGQRVVAYVVLREGKNASAGDFKTFLEDKVARYALPKEFIFRDSLPKSMIGKILKKELVKPS